MWKNLLFRNLFLGFDERLCTLIYISFEEEKVLKK